MIRDFRDLVIRPTLKHLAQVNDGLWTMSAEQLLLGTALAETAFQEIRQISGPALSFYQIEPNTARDIERYLDRPDKTALCALVDELRSAWPLDPDLQIVSNMALATAYARLKYWMNPAPLPQDGDVEEMALYWLQIYATPSSAATMTRFVQTFREHVLPLYN